MFEQFKLPAAHNINSLLVRVPSADHRQDPRARRRNRRPRPHQCRAAERSLGARREAADRRRDAGDHEARGQAAEGLDGPGRGRERRHDRSAEGGRLQIRDGLAGGRPAVLAEDARGADPVGALSGGAQRLAVDHPPREHARRVRRHDRRSVRRDGRAVRGAAAGDDALAASVRGRPAVPPAVAAQGAEALRRARQARPGVVDDAGAGRGLLLRAAAGNHSGRGAAR